MGPETEKDISAYRFCKIVQIISAQNTNEDYLCTSATTNPFTAGLLVRGVQLE